MSLAARITRLPLAHDPARGRDAAAPLPDGLRPLAEAAAGSSRYLAGLITDEAAWLAGVAGEEPEATLAALLEPPEAEDAATLDRILRRRRRRLALLTALADLGGVWDLGAVTGALTAFADLAVGTALRLHLAEEIRRGRLPEGADGLFVLAMGKMGARELNYSSDIDLICLFDETRPPGADYTALRSGYVRVVQRLVKSLAAQTEDGYVFRVDLRLRPDPSVTPVCIGAGVAEAYYESLGRTWERAAMIKARPCAGDLAAGAAFLAAIAPFVWRRHLDFAAIEDAHDMQRRIREHKGLGGPLQVPGHDVKLGRGGIRAIEFFVQTRQLICGGRDPDLRLRETVAALDVLARKGWILGEVAEALEDAYCHHRALEHRIQMLDDAQTHLVPKSAEARQRLAALSGFSDLRAFEGTLRRRFERVETLTDTLFAPGGPAGQGEAVTAGFLEDLGYRQPGRALELLERWRGGAIAATRSERARTILGRIAPEIVRRLAQAASADDAIGRFDAFLSGLPAGVQILSLFEANPQLLDLLAEVCAASPRLASELSRHANMLDAVLDRGFFDRIAGADGLAAALAPLLARAGDHERVLDAARRWSHEQLFRAGVQLLRGIATTEEAGEAFAAIAEACLRALHPHVAAAVARRHGPAPGRGAVILGMGKLGSREMTISSDLDLIVIYDAPEGAESAGPRRLAAPAWYARFAQTLVAALTAPTAEGRLYEVDMRLRPSGRKGPVAVSLAAFAAYQRTDAWTWEHMALTRARAVAGPADLAADVEAVIDAVRGAPRDRAKLMADAREMRERLARAHAAVAGDIWEVKQRPGGLMDIELALQAGLLATRLRGPRAPREAVKPLIAAGYLAPDEGAVLADALKLQTCVQQHARLALAGAFTPEAAGQGLIEALTRAAGLPDLAALAARLDRLTGEARDVVTAVLAR
jgi:glutamate-ammonia-ligase adenylyltransferase